MTGLDRKNTDERELGLFSARAARWWDKKGPMKALHDINPLRLAYIRQKTGISGRQILDVGCGGGILSEALAAGGARVTGIDLSQKVLEAAQEHARVSRLDIDYRRISAEELAERNPAQFDLVVCMELLEHVPRPELIVNDCAALAKPGGHLFFSTISRTWIAYLLVILAAERVLGVAEKGTHDYKRFIRPGELAQWAKNCGLHPAGSSGIMYMPFVRRAWLTRSMKMNYIMHFTRAD
ncbi:MAG: bifunctional 2-polyprenyl-6-hydroxyphenol methylase/3-demethylubiquinol 3-O-methyltransferase UbiG [Thermodesulfobacteriota bacterium]